jgi:hypothetical protein
MNRKLYVFAGLTVLLLLLSATSATAQGPTPTAKRAPNTTALGTGFTYQGQLKKNGTAVTSSCNFQFGLWDALSSGTQLGTTQTVPSVSVANGLFTTTLNSGNEFGANAFTGAEARWLAIAVQCTGDGSYTALTPRQPVSPAPFAFALPGLYTQQNDISPNVIGGYGGNSVTSGVVGATIGGGGSRFGCDTLGILPCPNLVTGHYGTVGGGVNNTANAQYATVGGGKSNQANMESATVAGGWSNTASHNSATVGGGANNTASGAYSTVSGGGWNTASGYKATVAGGDMNAAAGDFSFAAGLRAKANHNGTFVWGDSTDEDFASTADNQFLIRANSVGIGTNNPGSNKLHVGGKVRVDYASSQSNPQLELHETYGSYVRLNFTNPGSADYWTIAGHSDATPANSRLNFFTSQGTTGNVMCLYGNGKVSIGGGCIYYPTETLDVAGTAAANVIKIRGGSDLAERFEANSTSIIEPGTLMVIDDEHPGQLMPSQEAYDTKVAGIVSGAGGIVSGLTLQQEGLMEGNIVVAIAGRVYVKAEARSSAIKPGDLLTTSDIPGYAMKATDRQRAQGAIIGKAMSELKEGTGLVLVLVNLQ